MRLIDADTPELYDKVYCPVDNAGIEEYPRMIEWADIENAPTIDAVPVVQLREMLSNLESKCCGDGAETYTTGYRNGHRNGQIELLRYILQVPDGTSEEERKDGDGNG